LVSEKTGGKILRKEGVTMKQAVMTSPGIIEYRDVPEPEAGPNEINYLACYSPLFFIHL